VTSVGGGFAPPWVGFLLGGFGAAALLVAAGVLLRSQRAAAVLHPEDERRVRALLDEFGEDDSLGYFATRRDKAAVFSRSGKAAVTYRVELGVCLASGDPVGDPEAWGPAIEAWLAQARAHAWIPAVMGAGERGATAYARAGLKVLEIGDEAVLDLTDLDLAERDLRQVRQAVTRLRRTGHTVRIRRHRDLDREELVRITGLADAWRLGGTERGFSMALSRLGDPDDGDCVLVEALDAAAATVGLLSFVPWGRRGLSLDLMRRRRDAENGLTEFMVAELAGRGPELGVERISLNFAVFRSAFEDGARIGAGPVARVWRRLLLIASRWWQLESLYRANAKYRPQWVPRFLCFAERRELVKISLASVVAEGFLTLPGNARRLASATAPHAGDEVANRAAEPHVPATAGGSIPPTGGVGVGVGVGEQSRTRRGTVERLRAEGIDPYPVGFAPTAACADLARTHRDLPPGAASGVEAAVAGRVMRVRDHGGVVFATLRDWSGDLQVMLTRDRLGATSLTRFGRDVDLGDHLGVAGEVVASRRGEVSVEATEWTLTAKCLQPLPDKHRGLTDPQARVRHRHLDLIVRSKARDLLRARAAVVSSLREGLTRRGFLEVETPQLQPVHGGAAARPFTTHLQALDLDLYLRIAPELYLKRLCVGGVERVFELGRTFRNEGLSHKHNPEFTILEAYQAYTDYRTMLDLARELVQAAATATHGSPVARVEGPDGAVTEYDLSGQWPTRTVNEAISEALGEQVEADTDLAHLRRLCASAGVPADAAWGRGAVVLELYEHLVEARTQAPTFYLDFPTDVSPLTRPHRLDPRLAERWDLVAFGTELGTAYSELVDPVEQRRRLTEQSLQAAGGDPEAMQLDEDFLAALEYAMPPTGGLGLGVDRLVMALTGCSIRDSLAFPLVRARRQN
jgi:lysyl-tRNA synthetase class 2